MSTSSNYGGDIPPSVQALFNRDGQWLKTGVPNRFFFTCDCDNTAICRLIRREEEDAWMRECNTVGCSKHGSYEVELTELDKHQIRERQRISDILKRFDEEGDEEIEHLLAVAAEMAAPTTPYATMLDNIVDNVITKHIFISREEAIVLTLWIAHTWCLDAADVTPYIHLRTPMPRGGKTMVIEVMETIVARPFTADSLTAAVIARACWNYQVSGIEPPTFLMDEVDDIWKHRSELREIVNSGHKRGKFVYRASGRNTMRKMPIFSPKLMAGLKQLPDTVRDRSLQFEMLRATKSERPLPMTLTEERELAATAKLLRVQLQAFAENELGALFDAEPEQPEALNARTQKTVEPLLAIADVAGGDWPVKGREALVTIKRLMGMSDNTQNELKDLLSNVREVFGGIRQAIYAQDLLDKLVARDDWQWKSSKLTYHKMRVMLMEYIEGPGEPPIVPEPKMRLGADKKKRSAPKATYRREQFEDAWERWLGG